MRMTAVLMLAMALETHANTYSQNISLRSRDISLDKVFHLLNKQTGYSFFWDDQVLAGVGHVSVDVKNVTMQEALDLCLRGTQLTYTIREEGKAVYVFMKALPPPGVDSTSWQALETVRGVVVDSSGTPLNGATVMLRSSGFVKGTPTDKNGQFVLSDIPNGSYTLEVTSIGYTKYERRISVSPSTPALRIVLGSAISQLDETVVIGYGTQKRRELTAAVATVPMDKVAEIASPSINDELGGRMPGVFVTLSGGGPGQQASIYVRGGNNGNNPPLFVIDGFIRSQTDYLNINPNDVESLVVLKDAEATAVYGSQGGNGVVLITTKKGSYNGKPVFNYTFNQILTQPTVLPVEVGSYQRVTAINQVYQSLGLTPPYADSVVQYYQNQSKPYQYPNVNWDKLAFKTFAQEERHDFSVSAGNDALRYYGALSYYHQASLLKQGSDNAYNDRVTYRLNVENNLKKLGLKITTDLDGYVNTDEQPSQGYYGIFSRIANLPSTSLALNQYGLPYSGTSENPLQDMGPGSGYQRSVQRTFNSVLDFDWTLPFFKDVHLIANGSYNMYNTMNSTWSQIAPGYGLGSQTPIYPVQPSLDDVDGDGYTWNLQGMVTYNHAFGKHHIGFTGVYEQIQGKVEQIEAQRENYVIPIDQFFAGPSANQYGYGVDSTTASEGYVGRIQYNYAEKYFLEGSMRYDGSYLFPPNKRFGTFYGMSAGWVPTEEKFLHFLKDDHIVDFLKVRGSYGLVGNTNNIRPYEYESSYSAQSNAYVVNGQAQIGITENGQLPSTSFTWYSNTSSNIGVDFATLKNRLSGSFDYFYYVTKGFVVSDTAYAQTLGLTLPYVNSDASQRTAGVELGLNWDDHFGAFKYHIGVTYSDYSTLYPIYPGETAVQMENPYTRQSGVSQNYSTSTGYIASGLYSSNAAVLNGPLMSGSSNVAGGDIKYKDLNGDGQVNSNDQRVIGTSSFAHVNYGLNFDFGYKGWSLDGQFMGTGNRDITLGSVEQGSASTNILQFPYQYNYWTPTNTGATFPRQLPEESYNGNNNTASSTYWLINARYFRLKSLNLAYDLKQVGFLRKFPYINKCRIFVTGRNLFTLSNTMKYYIDPESDTNLYEYGVQRTFAIGCNLGF